MSWDTKKLGDICTITAGQSPEGKFYNNIREGLAFYQGKKLFGDKFLLEPNTWTSKITKRAKPGDILMSVRAPVGSLNITRQEVCIGRGLAAIHPEDSIDRDFLFYYLKCIEDSLTGSSGAVFNSINKNQIENIQILLPPLPVQKQIVEKLDAAFADIDKAISATERNIENAEVLFDSFLDSLLGEKKDTPLIDVCKRITDGSHYSPKTLGDEYPYITVKDISNDEIDFENCKFVDEKFYKELVKNNCNPVEGDILFSKDGTVGKVSIVDYKKNFVVLSSLAIISPNEKIINPRFLFFTLKSASFIKEAVEKKTGAAITRIILKTLKNIKIAIPNLDEQKKIISSLDKFNNENKKIIRLYKLKIFNLKQLKVSILNQALSGELTKDAA